MVICISGAGRRMVIRSVLPLRPLRKAAATSLVMVVFIVAPNTPFDWRSTQNDNLWQGVNGINNPCPVGYRLPTEAEWNAERSSWSSGNTSGAFTSPLKLPLVGNRSGSSGSLFDVGSYGRYWSSSVSGTDARHLAFNNNFIDIHSNHRALGVSVRCLSNEVVQTSLPTVSTSAVSSVTASAAVSGGNVTADGNAAVTARGVVWSTTQNPTVDSNSGITSNGSGTGSFESSISGLTGSTTYYVRAYATNSVGTAYGSQQSFTTPLWDRDTETTVVDVTNPATGRVWMDRNLGASRAATSSSDDQAYGDLYQWGRAADGHQKRTSPTTTTLSSGDQPGHGSFIISSGDWRSPRNDNLWQGVNGINNPCPVGYRLPTVAEWNAELGSWSSSNTSGAFASPLKLPSAGFRDFSTASLRNVGFDGLYWSGSVSGTDAERMHFHGGFVGMDSNVRAFGYSVRCLNNEAVQTSLPTVSTTAVSSVTASAAVSGGNVTADGNAAVTARGVVWSTTQNPTVDSNSGITSNGSGTGSFESSISGLTGSTTYYVRAYATNSVGTAYGSQLSFTTLWNRDTETTVVEVTNPATGRVWMDRNLGASRAATSSTDDQAYGDLYQWGRATDGHQKRTSSTTTTLSSGDQPGHGSFIVAPNTPNDWRNPQNDNLWQGVNGINNPCPVGYRLPTEAEWDAERASWSSSNTSGAFASPLKLPLAGYRHRGSGLFVDVSSGGYYWSGSESGTGARVLYFSSSDAGMFSLFRAYGFSARCLRD
jgi:uncharacterized protein (TIGR02145 family)